MKDSQFERIGTAKRIRVRLPLSGSTDAWDCRQFGFGRVVAPMALGTIEIAPRVELDLWTGQVRAQHCALRRSA